MAHLGVWSALYVAAAPAVLVTLSGLSVAPGEYAFAFLTALATYLLDRVKLRDKDLDPADVIAHPERSAFIRRHRVACRVLVALSALAAVGFALATEPLAAVLVPGSLLGVLVYARSKRRWGWRPKDKLAMKNPAVAGSITAFAVVLVALHAERPLTEIASLLLIPAIFLAQHVLADAALCDVDDRVADGRFGTRTVPVSLGTARAEAIALVVKLAAVVWPVALVLSGRVAWPAAGVWVAAPSVFAVFLVLAWRGRYRDPVDLAMPAAAVIAVAVASLS